MSVFDFNVRTFVYDTIKAGLRGSGTWFFLTLTTADDVTSDIKKDFLRLMSLLSKEIGDYEYFAMFTSEGNGVVHVLLKDCYVPRGWFINKWAVIHSSYIVFKKELGDSHAGHGYFMKHFSKDCCVGYLFSERWASVKGVILDDY